MTAQQDTLRNTGTHLLELLGIFEIFDNLFHLLFFFIASGHIRKAHLCLGFQLCSGFAEFKRFGIRIAAAHPVHHPDTDDKNEYKRNQRQQRIDKQV